MIIWTVLSLLAGWLVWNWKFGKAERNGKGKNLQNPEKQIKQPQKANSKDQKPESNEVSAPSKEEPQTKKFKNKVDHPFFFKSFKKNDSNIKDFDFSLDNHFLAIASKDTNNILYDIAKDKTYRFTSGRFKLTNSQDPHQDIGF